MQSIHDLVRDVSDLKAAQLNSEYAYQQAITSDSKRRERTEVQSEDLLGMHTAVVTSTIDPLKQGRVRFYTPFFSDFDNDDGGLPWASPISAFGGFDDSGSIWVPPAGSRIAVLFDKGNRNSAYYLGTIWDRHRGPDGQHLPFWNNRPIPEYQCFPENTDVITSDGVKLISEVNIGDHALTHTNHYRKVTGKSCRKYCGPAIKVRTFGSNKPIICTPEHPLRVSNGVKCEWKKACEITKGEWVVYNKLNVGIPIISSELVELLGWYITEGSLGKNHVSIALNKKETDVKDRIVDLAKNCFDANCSVMETPTALCVNVNSVQFRDLCLSQCGRGASNKKIPFSLISGYEELMYETLLKGDGHRRPEDDSFGTVSKTLGYHLVLLANQIGKVATLQESKSKGKSTIQGREVNVKDMYFVRVYTATNNYRSRLKSRQHNVMAKVRSVENIEISEEVYNLEVAQDHSYTANGRVVHNCLWDGRRDGYLFGDDSGDEVLPPWNTEMYNGYDNDSETTFYTDPSQYNLITYPYIKGFKTEQKHYMKFVDGDPRCNRRWTRVEMSSGRGNYIMFKDDHLHPAGQWAFGGGGESCHQTDPNQDIPIEHPCCDCNDQTPQKCATISCTPILCPQACSTNPTVDRAKFRNPFYKRTEEMRPYNGANTPQANACRLDQSGVQMQSLSGHQMVFDDSVNQPTGVPTWKLDFDFGCDDTYRGSMYMNSATGHNFTMSDLEDVGTPKVRGEDNYIGMTTATGNFFQMNDHTLPDGPCKQKIAGAHRGITMMSTSTHLFQMNDNRLQQASPIRKNGGQPHPADKDGFEGYILLRSGYGLQLLMKDTDRQDKTVQQFIQLMAPQKDNKKRGPHMLVMQEVPSGPGMVLLRAGGVYFLSTYDQSIEVVGEPENPSSKFVEVTDSYLVDVKKTYFNHNDTTVFFAEEHIFLLAGRDCPPPPGDAAGQSQAGQSQSMSAAKGSPGSAAGKSQECGPCVYNVIVSKDPWVCPFTDYVHFGVGEMDGVVLDSRSTRVFASAKNEAGSPGCGGGTQ